MDGNELSYDNVRQQPPLVLGILGVSLLILNEKLNELPAFSARFRFRPGEPQAQNFDAHGSRSPTLTAIEPPTEKQAGSTPPRRGGDRPPGRPRRVRREAPNNPSQGASKTITYADFLRLYGIAYLPSVIQIKWRETGEHRDLVARIVVSGSPLCGMVEYAAAGVARSSFDRGSHFRHPLIGAGVSVASRSSTASDS